MFAEPAASTISGSAEPFGEGSASKLLKKPVVVFVPSPIPPLTWTNRRVSLLLNNFELPFLSADDDELDTQKTYLQLALKLRRQGYCVVIPDVVSDDRSANGPVDQRS